METARSKLENIKARERTKVKATFVYHECPGGVLEFNFNMFKDDPIEKWKFLDGEIREVPLYIAKHLNNSGIYKTEERQVGPDGEYKVTTPLKRYSFNKNDFIDVYDKSKEIVIAEKISSVVKTK